MNSFKEVLNKIIKNKIIKKFFNKETINYLIFGVLTTVVNYVVYIIVMFLFGVDEGENSYLTAINTAIIVSWILAVAFAYITNKIYVFESKSFESKVVFKEIVGFVGARLFSLGCEILWMNVTVSPYIGMNDKIAKILANVFIVIMNYFFSKFFIFKKNKK